MQKYKCHKVVKAAEITFVYPVDTMDSFVQLQFAGTEQPVPYAVLVSKSTTSRYWPEIGDFLVEYEDGYTSISPRKAFLEGYALLEEDKSSNSSYEEEHLREIALAHGVSMAQRFDDNNALSRAKEYLAFLQGK